MAATASVPRTAIDQMPMSRAASPNPSVTGKIRTSDPSNRATFEQQEPSEPIAAQTEPSSAAESELAPIVAAFGSRTVVQRPSNRWTIWYDATQTEPSAVTAIPSAPNWS